MKRDIYLSIILCTLASSCGNLQPIKPLASPGNGGSWTFKGNTYTTSVCFTGTNSLNAKSTSPPYSSISVFFPGSVLPTDVTDTYSTYRVVNTRPIGNQVNIRVTTDGGNTMYAGRGENDSVKVSFTITSFASTSGKMLIEGSGIEMLNVSNPSDSAPLTLNMMQTQ